MKAAEKEIKSWLERECALEGVLAAGFGLVGASGFAAFATGEMVLANTDDVWLAISINLGQVTHAGAPVDELLWGFKDAVLCTVTRPDGAWLGVFTVPKLDDHSAHALRQKLDAFKAQSTAPA